MKTRLKRVFSFVTALILLLTAVPFTVTASAATFNQIVNAATYIIIYNEGNYSTVVKNDVGALSIGVIGWHATNALNLLKDIIAKNPSQALSILGPTLYNEIITSSYWETRIATSDEAAVISVLLSTTEGRQVQDETAARYISGYVQHGQKLGITEAEALVFFADYQNQNGYTGAENFFNSVKRTYGTVNLYTLYNGSNKSSRRTRTYNFCATINWSDYTDSIHGESDTEAPVISNVTLTSLSESGYTITCDIEDNREVVSVYFAIYYKKDGTDGVKWYQQTPSGSTAAHTVEISEFSGRAGDYCTYIYAFDEEGNYSYVELNVITVPEVTVAVPELSVTISSTGKAGKGETIRWSASAANGSGNYQYKFGVYKDGKLVDVRKYLDYPDYEYTPTESGVYKVSVIVKDTASGKTATVDSPEINVFDPIITEDFSCADSAAMFGQVLTWNLKASGGEGELGYSYTVYKDNTAVYSSDWTTSTSYSHKTEDSGIYYVVVNIMDSRLQTVSVKSNEVTVIRPLEVGNVTFSDSYAVTGRSVTLSADVSGGTGEYTCNFSIYCDGVEVVTSEIVNSSEFTFKVPEGGYYTAKVTVTDADSTVTEASGGGLSADDTAKRGDANCDGTVSAADARFVLRCSAKLDIPEEGLEYAADVSGDGKITAADARTILRISARLEY